MAKCMVVNGSIYFNFYRAICCLSFKRQRSLRTRSEYAEEKNERECRYDPGGYFIVNGNEKVIMSVEKMVDQ